MELFFNVIFSFPTVIFTFLLCIAFLYWCIAALGLLDIDALDSQIDFDHNLDVANHATDGNADDLHITGLAGLLLRFGLDGVPLTIVLTGLFFFGFTICYFIELFLLRFIPLGFLRIPLGALVIFISLFPAAYITGIVFRPLRKCFIKSGESALNTKSAIGQVAVVRTGSVTSTFGEALYQYQGIELLLKIRADESLGLKRGDRVVLIDYSDVDGTYQVVTEDDFKGI